MINIIKSHQKAIVIWIISLACFSSFIYWNNPERVITITLGTYVGSHWDVPDPTSYKLLDRIIKNFEKENPTIKVKYEPGIAKSDYSSWLSDLIVQGKQPDVFIVPDDDFNLLLSTGALDNLNRLVKEDRFNTNIFFDSAIDAGVVNHEVYALPFSSNPVMMCVNMDILKKEGITIPDHWTIEEFYDMCNKITKDTDHDGVLDQFGVCDYTWKDVIAGYGISLFNEEGTKSYFNSSKVKKAFAMLSKITHLNKNIKVSSEDFDKGKVAFMPMTLAQYRTYKPYPYRVAKYSTFSWNCRSMPTSTSNAAYQMKTALIGLSSRSNHKQSAWKFLKMICSDPDVQQLILEQSQGASPVREVMNDSFTDNLFKRNGFGSSELTAQRINTIMEQTIAYPKFKKYARVMEVADYLVTLSLANNSLDADLSQIHQNVQKLL